MTRKVETGARNLLITLGAYYLCRWLDLPLGFGYAKLTNGIIYRGEFAGAVILPLVEEVPVALFALAAGVSIAWLVESKRPIRWAIIPAALYAFLTYRGYHWHLPPSLGDRVGQIIAAIFPAVCCLGGAAAYSRRIPGGAEEK
jgi:hypothetical protein